jgi:superfamily I DNA/RNA helicase
MQLTAEQTNAIRHANGNLQLIACAGSGKTEVVAQHITKLLIPVAEGAMGMKPTNKLEANFRSTPGITDVARLAIEKNPSRLEKKMESWVQNPRSHSPFQARPGVKS